MSETNHILDSVYRVILERKANPDESSYTASLMKKGLDSVLKKVGEEATELVIAGKGGSREEIIYETADLLFHTLVLLGYHDIPPEEIYLELRRRFGISGIAEKNSRS
jgi:phosphoribosyl-ATP pyrophosphohydrolase